jgi:serine/threonine-protein kinase
MLSAGDVIAERYRLLEPIASGGMGAVWRAAHLELDVHVALKVLLEAEPTPSGERRFRQEARAAAKLRSPHVVQIRDFGVHDRLPFLVMELLDGEDLASRLERCGPLSPHEVGSILDGVARAIDLAHDHGIIHRDLKPGNIFLARVGRDDEVVKVLDFGIAKVDGSPGASTTGAGLVGSPAYMSPEQVWAEGVTSSTDLWSMGVVAMEMLVGRNPFDATPLARVFQRIVTDDIPRLSSLRPGLPDELDAFFERALARDPAARFPSALAMAAAFREAAAPGSAILSAASSAPSLRPTPSTRSPRASATTSPASDAPRKPRLRVVALAAALLVGSASGAFFWVRASVEPDSPKGSASAHPPASAARPIEARSPASATSDPSPVPSAPEPSSPKAPTKRSPSAPAQPARSARPVVSTPAASVDPLFGIPMEGR